MEINVFVMRGSLNLSQKSPGLYLNFEVIFFEIYYSWLIAGFNSKSCWFF